MCPNLTNSDFCNFHSPFAKIRLRKLESQLIRQTTIFPYGFSISDSHTILRALFAYKNEGNMLNLQHITFYLKF